MTRIYNYEELRKNRYFGENEVNERFCKRKSSLKTRKLPKLQENNQDNFRSLGQVKRRSVSNPKTVRTSSTVDRNSYENQHDGSQTPIYSKIRLDLENYRSKQLLQKLRLPEPENFANISKFPRSVSTHKKTVVFDYPNYNAPVLTKEAPTNISNLNFHRRLKDKIINKIYCLN